MMIPVLDISKFNVCGFEAIQKDGKYNLQIILIKWNSLLQSDSAMEKIQAIQTEIFEDNLLKLKKKINVIKKCGLLGDKGFVTNGSLLDAELNIVETIDWELVK